MRFISPKTDFAFKKIFAGAASKDILISFLNAIIYGGEAVIQDLEIIDPYNPSSILSLKDSYLDVRAVLQDDTTVIIEMQVLNVEAFEKRVVYNLSKTYANQLKSGQGYFDLSAVIALTITDFKLFDQTEKIITRFSFQEEDESFEYIDSELTMVFVELPKFNKELSQLETLTDKWMYFLKEGGSLDTIPSQLAQVQEIEEALHIANKAGLSVEELEELDRREMFWQDQLGAVVKGIREGREEGRLQERLDLILTILQQRWGEISEPTVVSIKTLSFDRLGELALMLFNFTTVEDLTNWLHEQLL